MKKTKKSPWWSIDRLLSALLVLLGFSSCGNEPGDTPCEYGTPYATYEVKGKVVNKTTKTPVANIQVKLSLNREGASNNLPTQSGQSTGAGEFTVSSIGFPTVDVDYKLTVTDVDGPANGGTFKAATTDVSFKDIKPVGGEHWNAGKATQTITIELEKEEP